MENKSLKQIIANRHEKLDKIRQLGVNPYPYEFNTTHSTLEITKDNIDQNVSVAGRVMSLRKMGKAAFANIQDE
ncbi:lysine--tRNA ligase, partial [Candidatus Marinimicrobia bacterium]|nr:lysine--tRNA ligase [Candidatus Neomarinimicrobiota bacterium]